MSHSTGGYLYDFVPDVPLNYICVSCNLPLKKPHQISICGHRICLQCFESIRQERMVSKIDLTCPHDEESINGAEVYPDIAVEKELLNWNVKCENHMNSCLWVGPLKELEKHQVLCSNKAEENIVLEAEFVLKNEMEMMILKLRNLESRMEVYESKVANQEQQIKRYEKEIANYKKSLSEQSSQLNTVQRELNILKYLLPGEIKGNMNGKVIDQSSERDDNKDIQQGILDKSDHHNQIETAEKSTRNLYELVRALKIKQINGNKGSDESMVVLADKTPITLLPTTRDFQMQTDFNNSYNASSSITIDCSKYCGPCKESFSEGSSISTLEKNQNADISNALFFNNTTSDSFKQSMLWRPKNISRLGTGAKLSPKFKHAAGFCFQVSFDISDGNLNIGFINIDNQEFPSKYQCRLIFIANSKRKRQFNFDLSIVESQLKKFPLQEFKKHYESEDTKIIFNFVC